PDCVGGGPRGSRRSSAGARRRTRGPDRHRSVRSAPHLRRRSRTMIPGLTGSLLSHDALARAIPEALGRELDQSGSGAAQRRMLPVHAEATTTLGPASSARAVFDRVAAPFAAELGFRVSLCPSDRDDVLRARLDAGGAAAAALLVTPWGRDPGGVWREA